MRDGKLDLLGGALQQVHVGPRDDVLGQGFAEHLGDLHGHTLEQRMNGAQQTARTHLGTKQAQLVLAGGGQLDVVHAHDLHALRVDDLLVHDVARQQHLIGL